MIASSLVITIVGMAVVFTFLILLVVSMNILSAVVLRFFPEKKEKEETSAAQVSGSADAEVAAAIAVAYSKS